MEKGTWARRLKPRMDVRGRRLGRRGGGDPGRWTREGLRLVRTVPRWQEKSKQWVRRAGGSGTLMTLWEGPLLEIGSQALDGAVKG